MSAVDPLVDDLIAEESHFAKVRYFRDSALNQ